MTVTEALRDGFAPHGRLRIALNYGNPVLLGLDAGGRPQGISVDLAQDLADWLGLSPDFVEFARAADVTGAAGRDLWDICFLAVDPERAGAIDFTRPYVGIDGCYLASARCPARDAGDLVASAAPVGCVVGSAYALTLQRKPGADALVPYADFAAMMAALDAFEVDAVAGIGPVMAQEAGRRPGARVLAPPFMQIRQAMGILKGRPEAARALQGFLAVQAQSGRIGDILERHGVARSCALLSG